MEPIGRTAQEINKAGFVRFQGTGNDLGEARPSRAVFVVVPSRIQSSSQEDTNSLRRSRERWDQKGIGSRESWEKILIRGRTGEGDRRVERKIAVYRCEIKRKKDRHSLPFVSLFFTPAACSLARPARAFPICSRKIWIVDSPIPFLPFHANSISAFCAWESRRYIGTRSERETERGAARPHPLALLNVSFVTTCLPSLTG